jgi:hypothetical protein
LKNAKIIIWAWKYLGVQTAPTTKKNNGNEIKKLDQYWGLTSL